MVQMGVRPISQIFFESKETKMDTFLVTNGQKFALIKLCSRFTKLRKGRLYLLSKLTGREIKTTSDILLSEWRSIRDEAYPDWHNNNWEMANQFEIKCKTIMAKFEKDIMGQLSFEI